MIRLIFALGYLALAGLLAAGPVFADNCSGPADCEQTAGYNTGLAVIGGILATGAGLFGSQIASSIAALFPGLGGPGGGAATTDPGAGPGLAGPTLIVDPWTGEPLTVWEPGKYGVDERGNPGGPGQVWMGEWMDPERAREVIRVGLEADLRRAQESQAFWEESQRLSDQWLRDRTDQLQRKAAAEAQAHRAREDAWKTLVNIENIAAGHEYGDILRRADAAAFNPDGTINVDYVNQLRDALRARLGRDAAAPDESLNQSWVSDFASNTFDDARHNPLIRVGAGILTGGSSGIYYQSQAAWEAMERSFNAAADQGRDWTTTDALRAGMRQLGEENLPLNTIKTLQDPNASWTNVAGNLVLDAFITVDVMETAGNLLRGAGHAADTLATGLRGLPESRLPPHGGVPDVVPPRNVNELAPGTNVHPREFGMPEMNGRGFQATADKHLVRIETRATNPEALVLLEQGHPPKPPELHSKTINEWDTYLGARSDDVGKVGYFRPELPEVKPANLSDADWAQVQKRNIQRVNEFADQELHMHHLTDQGLVKVENGVVIDTGLTGGPGTGKAFTGDHDVFRITGLDGTPVPEALREQIIKDFSPFGAEHPAHVDWTPAPGVDMEIDRAVIGSHVHGAEEGDGNALIAFRPDRAPVTSYARPEDFHFGSRPPAETTFEWLGGTRETP